MAGSTTSEVRSVEVEDTATASPILFSSWSVGRIFGDAKWQTRRLINPQPPPATKTAKIQSNGKLLYVNEDGGLFYSEQECPYGQEGDVLWVREAFRLPATAEEMSPKDYVGQPGPNIVRWEADEEPYNATPKCGWGRKRPSIYMPAELCRLKLRLNEVRVERAKDISHEDAVAEGIPEEYDPDVMPDGIGKVSLDNKRRTIHQLAFKGLWETLHGTEAWKKWVWVLSFSLIDD